MTPCRLMMMLVALLPGEAGAFTLQPIGQVLDASGSGTSAVYEVRNPGGEPVAVQFRVAHLVKHADGSEDLSRIEEDDFLIYPPQMVIPAGTTRSVRVRWIGDPRPDRELSYRFLADQVPVVLPSVDPPVEDGANVSVQFIYQVHGTLFVRPPHTRPELDVVGAWPTVDGEGLVLRIENPGTQRGWVRDFTLRLVVGGRAALLTAAEAPALEGLPILAGGAREVVVPWPDGVSGPIDEVHLKVPRR